MNKTINDWLVEYNKILSTYNIKGKTLENRASSIKWIKKNLGDYELEKIKPYEIALPLKEEYKVYPSKSKRLLIEIKNMFTEAIIYDWTERNPASHLKNQRAPVQRKRISLDDFNKLYEYAKLNAQPWVVTMLLLAVTTGQRRSDLMGMKYSDIVDGHLLITQQKTGTRISIPTKIRLNAIGVSLEEVIEKSKLDSRQGAYILRKNNGDSPCPASLSASFEKLVDAVLISNSVSLHDCRSLSERLYREQGLNTRLLLGHMSQRMTDMYNDDRGLNKETYTVVPI